jgi:hypothetical protein
VRALVGVTASSATKQVYCIHEVFNDRHQRFSCPAGHGTVFETHSVKKGFLGAGTGAANTAAGSMARDHYIVEG